MTDNAVSDAVDPLDNSNISQEPDSAPHRWSRKPSVLSTAPNENGEFVCIQCSAAFQSTQLLYCPYKALADCDYLSYDYSNLSHHVSAHLNYRSKQQKRQRDEANDQNIPCAFCTVFTGNVKEVLLLVKRAHVVRKEGIPYDKYS